MNEIYLDNNATTLLDPRVLDVMLPILRAVGNASSAHFLGVQANAAIEDARARVALLIGASPREIIFTSGATEANNLALAGVVAASKSRRKVVTASTEHPSVLGTAQGLAAGGYYHSVVDVDEVGLLNIESLRSAVDTGTAVVSIMAANNETGTLAPMAAIAEVVHANGALFHTDATQLLAWGPINVDEWDVDLLSLSAHKLHGPQGVGALYVSRQASRRIRPVHYGGGHERGLRSGTLNTAGIAGLGAAAEFARSDGEAAAVAVAALRDGLHSRLIEHVGPVVLNGHPTLRLPCTLNVSFDSADAEAVMAGAPCVAVATGSACSTGHPGPSHVLTAMGVDEQRASTSLRFGLSRFTTGQEVVAAADQIGASVMRVRERSRRVMAQ